MLRPSPAAPAEVRGPPGNAGCALTAQAMRLGPRDTSAATKIKEKETKHYGRRGSPFKAPKPRQARASLSLHSRVGGREAKGEGSPFPPPPRAPRHSATPQVLKVLLEPAGQQWREGESFLTSCLAPLNCTRVLGSPRGLRAPSLPTLGNRLGSQRRQRRSAFSRPSSLQPEPARRGPTGLGPAPGRWRAPPSRCGPGPGSRAHLWSAPGPRLPVLPVEEGPRGASCRKHAPAAHAPKPQSVRGCAAVAHEPGGSAPPSPRAASRS